MPDLSVVPCRPEQCEAWDAFVEASHNGTTLHRQDFLAYHPQGRFCRDDRLVYDGERLVGLLPLGRTDGEDGRAVGKSPYGASYGGLVTGALPARKAHAVAAAVLEQLRAEGYARLEVCFAPSCYWREFDCTVEYVFLKAGQARLVRRHLTSVIDVAARHTSQSYRRNARGAEKAGVRVGLSRDFAAFYRILEETVEEKHGAAITHTRDELERLASLVGDRMRLYAAWHDDEMIAGILTFENASPCVLAFYNAHRQRWAELNALNLVLDCLVADCGGRKAWIDLGTTDAFLSDYNWGLFQYKESAGGRGLYRDHYVLDLAGVGRDE